MILLARPSCDPTFAGRGRLLCQYPFVPGSSVSSLLPRSLLVSYGLPMSAYLLMSLRVGMWLMKFATDTLLMAPAAMGGIHAVARVWDAILDPLAGYLSDRTRSPLGRRRSWQFASAIPLAATYVMI